MGYLYEGGYENPKTINLSIFMGFMAALSGIPLPFFDNSWAVRILLWFLLFWGGALMPTLMG